MAQLQMPFVAEMDLQLAKDRAAAEKKRHKERAAYTLKSMIEWHPPSSEEWDVMLMGIRIDRFVSDLECEKCRYATEDHTAGNLFTHWIEGYNVYGPIKMCLKDYYRVKGGD